jgi:polyisoprenoid-binding protein YceI
MRKPATTVARAPLAALIILLGLLAAACSGGASSASATPAAPTEVALPAATEAAPAGTATEASPAPATEPAAATPAGAGGEVMRLVLAASGNEARYRVREQLANLAFPSDAVGSTQAVTGQLVITTDGQVVAEESEFAVDLSTLTSDSGRRDNFIRRNTLQTDAYPLAVFVPRSAIGLPAPLPMEGAVSFQLVGDMTVRGTTTEVTWNVTAQAAGGRELTGQATTAVTFGDLGLEIPRVPMVLSVQDTIGLELDFHLVRDEA